MPLSNSKYKYKLQSSKIHLKIPNVAAVLPTYPAPKGFNLPADLNNQVCSIKIKLSPIVSPWESLLQT